MNDDRTDDQLRELLDSAAPDQPDLPVTARTTAVRDRASAVRRRNRLVLVAAVVAAVGIGIAVPVLGSGDDPDRTTEVAGDPPATNQEPPDCPADAIDVSQGLKVDELPDGAISARACSATFEGTPGMTEFESVSLPEEPLVTDVDAFTSAVRDLPAYTLESDCALSTPVIAPWVVVVSYPDGTSVPIGTTTQSCAPVPVAGVDRSADEIVSLYYDALGVERTDPTGSGGITPGFAPDCPTDQAGIDEAVTTFDTYDGDVADFRVEGGTVCYVRGDETEPAFATSEAFINPVRLDAVGADLATGTTPAPQRAGRCTENGPRRVIVLNDEDDASLTLVENSCTGEYAGPGFFWLPGEAAGRAIEIALDGSDFE